MVFGEVAGGRIDHGFTITMIGGDEEEAVLGKDLLADLTNILIDYTDGFAGGFEVTSMGDHIRVGEIDNNEFIGISGDSFEDFLSDLSSSHFGVGLESFWFG